MNYQERIFAQDELWRVAREQHAETERAGEIGRLVPIATRSALDAGCGNGVVAHTLRLPFVVALDLSRTALQYVRVPRVQGDLSRLPFQNGQFDLTICSEVLEHLPVDLYDQVLQEIGRVSRHQIIVTVPWDQSLDASQVHCPQCRCRFQPHGHVRSFSALKMQTLFLEHGFPITDLQKVGEKRPRVGLNRIMRIMKLNQFPTRTVCPQCGFQRPSSTFDAISSQINSTNGHQIARRIAKVVFRVWPRGPARPRWWLARYARANELVAGR